MPRLIATATPNFSRFFIWSFQRITHGSKARIKSVAAEYATIMGSISGNSEEEGKFSYANDTYNL